MRYIDLGDKRIETNEHGFVVDPYVWTKELAEHTGMDFETAARALELFAEDVLPALKGA